MRAKILVYALAALILAIVHIAQAQQPKKVPRIGLLSTGSPSSSKEEIEPFRQGLRDLGYIEGQNIAIEYRYSGGVAERLPNLAAELVQLKVDIIVVGGSPSTQATKNATKTIPIVMTNVTDPVGLGLVASLAHPGGNVTGLTTMSPEIIGKRLELIREVLPTLRRFAVIWDEDSKANAAMLTRLKSITQSLGVEVRSLPVRPPVPEIDKAIETAKSWRASALTTLDDALLFGNRTRIIALAARHRLPAIYGYREFPDAGGLMAYGPNRYEMYRRAATYVDKILKGVKPADLPVEQPTKFEFVINLKTAKALGLTIPPSLLARADQVIE